MRSIDGRFDRLQARDVTQILDRKIRPRKIGGDRFLRRTHVVPVRAWEREEFMSLRFIRAALVAAGLLIIIAPARAAVVYSGPLNLTIPNTGPGLFVNVVTGSAASVDPFPVVGGPAGNWDIDLFGSTLWGLYAPFAAGQSQPFVQANQTGYVAAVGGTFPQALNLPAGTTIGPSSNFSTQPDADINLATGQPAIFGFRFRNEQNSPFSVHYGWARVILTNGQPGTLVDYGWEAKPDTAIGAGAVPEP